MAKVLSMEISSSLIRLCEVDYKTEKAKVYKWATIQTPEGAVVDDVLVVDDILVSAIKAALREKHISTKKMVFAMNSTKIATRETVIPFIKENKVGDLINANAFEYFPVDLEQYELGHNILGIMENEKGVKQYKVQVFAVPKNILESYTQLATALGGTVEAFDYSGNSVYQMVKNHCAEGVQLLVKIDERTSIITVLNNKGIVMQRTISYGVEDTIAAIMSTDETMSYSQAVANLKEYNYFNVDGNVDTDGFAEINSSPAMSGEVSEEINASLNHMVSGILRVVDYYNSHNAEAPIEAAHVTGLGGECKGIDECFAASLGVETFIIQELEGFKLEKTFKKESFGPYLTCIGAAIAPLGFVEKHVKKRIHIQLTPSRDNMLGMSVIVLIGGIIIAVVLAEISYLQLKEQKDKYESLYMRNEELAPLRDIYQEYLQQEYTTTKLRTFHNSTVMNNENLVDFIEEMEEKMPSSLNVQSLIGNNESVTLTLTVADKKEAAKLIEQFRTFRIVSSVSVSGISDTGAVMEGEPIAEEGKVSFTITIIYKGADELEAERLAEEAAAAEAAAAEAAESAE